MKDVGGQNSDAAARSSEKVPASILPKNGDFFRGSEIVLHFSYEFENLVSCDFRMQHMSRSIRS